MDTAAVRLRLSNAEAARLVAWAAATTPPPEMTEAAFARTLYRGDRMAVVDRLRLALAGARGEAVASGSDAALMRAGAYARLLDFATAWSKPQFPLSGGEIVAAGVPKGPHVGRLQKVLEDGWVAADFRLSKQDLLERLDQLLRADGELLE